MTLRSLSLAGAFVLAATLVAHAADITGKWTAQVPGRDGQTRETTFDFKVDGEKLTGTTTGMQRRGADRRRHRQGRRRRVHRRHQLPGQRVKILYKGTVAGDEIKFTRQREGGDRVTEFVARRQVAKPTYGTTGAANAVRSFRSGSAF